MILLIKKIITKQD